MAAVYLWIRAEHYSAILYDTDDLATIRGGSMLLEDFSACAKAHFAAALIDWGASRALLRLDSDAGLSARVNDFLIAEPWRYFLFSWGIGPDHATAKAAAKAMKPGLWTIPPLRPQTGKAPDPLDGMRPATVTEHGPDGDVRLLSTSTNARRQKGRTNRPWIFADDTRASPQSFTDIVANPPTHIATVVQGKLAVVTADGVGFGEFGKAFRAKVALTTTDADTPPQMFAEALDRLRQRLARRIETWARDSGLEFERFVPVDQAVRLSARVDVLVWGGDDMTFVLPASHVFPFLEMFYDEMAKPFAPGIVDEGLPHRIGVIIAQFKTPIRLMRRLAGQSQKLVRDWLNGRKESAFAIDIYESSTLAYDGVEGYRRALYGPDCDPKAATFKASDLQKLKGFFAGGHIGADTGAALSTSQIHAVLQRLRAKRLQLWGTDADALAKDMLNRHVAARDGGNAPVSDWIETFSDAPRRLPVMLAEISQLEPYARAGWVECRAAQPDSMDSEPETETAEP